MTTKIKFGTDGWRAVIAKDFTVESVIRISEGVAQYLKCEKLPLKVVIGYDCRFNGGLFSSYVAKTLQLQGIQVVVSKQFVTTPMVSFAAQELNCGLGVVITASHNPPEYNGYKLKSRFGGPLIEEEIRKVEQLIPDSIDFEAVDQEDLNAEVFADIATPYLNQLKKKFDLEAIVASPIKAVFNPMFGSGQGIFKSLLSNVEEYKSYQNPLFEGISPEPIMKNLKDFQLYLQQNQFDLAMLVDGDADRIGLMDGMCNYITSHHIMLILLWILVKYKKLSGEVATGFSSTDKIRLFCEKENIPLTVVPIGFKHISNLMQLKDILMGGEESGGISVKGHIPERDGIYNNLLILEFLAQNNLSVHELLGEIESYLGKFYYNRLDLKITENQKQKVLAKLQENSITQIGNYKVEKVETLDGFKFRLAEGEWVMARLSGTEPLVRIYCESEKEENVDLHISHLKQQLGV